MPKIDGFENIDTNNLATHILGSDVSCKLWVGKLKDLLKNHSKSESIAFLTIELKEVNQSNFHRMQTEIKWRKKKSGDISVFWDFISDSLVDIEENIEYKEIAESIFSLYERENKKQ